MVGTHWIHKIHLPNWVVGILALVLILRIPTFFEPYYYGDEMIYLTMGQGVREGITLYKDIHDNKPPLLYLAAAAAGNLFWFKAILAFWMLATTAFFYKLSVRLFEKNKRAQIISTLVFALLTTLPTLEGNTVNAELFMIGPSIIAFLLLLDEKITNKKILWAGFLFGIATLFKVPAAFDLPVIIAFWLITLGFASWRKILRRSFLLFSGFIFPIALTMVWYALSGAGGQYISAAFLQNVGYLSSFRPEDVQKSFLVRNAPLLLRALVVLVGSGVLWIFRKKLSKKFLLASIWLLFSLFAVTLSERPYPHYLVQSAAPMAVLLAMFFAEKSREQALTVIPLALALFIPFYYKFYDYSVITYYQRFVNFATQRISKETYFSGFAESVGRNYMIAEFLAESSKPDEKVFMWDPDSPTVYALSRRFPPIKYVVPYHINDFSSREETVKQIGANPPKFVILTSKNPYPELMPIIEKKYLLITQIGDADIWVRTNLVR